MLYITGCVDRSVAEPDQAIKLRLSIAFKLAMSDVWRLAQLAQQLSLPAITPPFAAPSPAGPASGVTDKPKLCIIATVWCVKLWQATIPES